ncbi:hypothetical protein ACWGLE_30040, partial [Streptomyces sp. NPDC055897]
MKDSTPEHLPGIPGGTGGTGGGGTDGSGSGDSGSDGLVWYASYGSNMHLDRLAHYIEGGRPAGAARSYPGCRD